MLKINKIYKKFEKTIGGLKFAVIIISLFAIALVYGTFMESYHGTEYANRLVYKSWWFMGIQGGMFLSILMATLIRLPARKALYGFYTIHAGLITLFIGSFITYTSGVDGHIQLLPNAPSNKVLINEDLLRIEFPNQNKVIRFSLPFNASATNVNGQYNDIKVETFLPSATNETIWVKSDQKLDHSGTYLLFNDERGISQEVTFALNPNSDFKSTDKLGLLNIHYMPKALAHCFSLNSDSGYIIWNTENGECYTPESKNIDVVSTPQGSKFLTFEYNKEWLKFFPDFSPLPIKDDLTRVENSPYKVFSRTIFKEKPHLFIFGDQISYFHKRKKQWIVKGFEDSIVGLPWMGFKLRLLEHRDDEFPVKRPSYIKPVQSKGEIIKGQMKAVQVDAYGKKYWVTSDAPLILDNGTDQIRFRIAQKELLLPYQIHLDRFKMDKNPGTNNPASYESFVTLLDGRTSAPGQEHHVFMNNPLKYDGFTFYQSSYFPIGQDEYGSVFSVNFDPGRPIKYFGSLLLVLGSIWHYLIRRKKRKPSRVALAGEINA